MHVDPDPSVTEQVMSKLGWSSEGNEALPVSPAFVRAIDDEVVLDVERDEEFKAGTS